MALDYKKLKQLREETEVSFSLCKKALEEADNNLEAAKKKLQKWGAKKAEQKAERATGDGGIFSYVHHNRKVATLVELQCETDFVSGNEEFIKIGQELAMQLATVRADSVEELTESNYIREPSKTIKDLIQEAVLKFGENIRVARISRWELGAE